MGKFLFSTRVSPLTFTVQETTEGWKGGGMQLPVPALDDCVPHMVGIDELRLLCGRRGCGRQVPFGHQVPGIARFGVVLESPKNCIRFGSLHFPLRI